MYKYCFSADFFLVNGFPGSGNEHVIPVGKVLWGLLEPNFCPLDNFILPKLSSMNGIFCWTKAMKIRWTQHQTVRWMGQHNPTQLCHLFAYFQTVLQPYYAREGHHSSSDVVALASCTCRFFQGSNICLRLYRYYFLHSFMCHKTVAITSLLRQLL